MTTEVIFSSTRPYLDNSFWGVVTAAVEELRCKANIVAQGHGKCDPEADSGNEYCSMGRPELDISNGNQTASHVWD